jgi:hypothetical protein
VFLEKNIVNILSFFFFEKGKKEVITRNEKGKKEVIKQISHTFLFYNYDTILN